MNRVYLEITDGQEVMTFLTEAKKKGLLKDISAEKVEMALRQKAFPIKVPISLDGIIGLAGNPVVKKMFGRKIDDAAIKYLKAALETG